MNELLKSFLHFARNPSYLIVGFRKHIPFLRLNPLRISLKQAEKFFATFESENNGIIEPCLNDILSSKVFFDVGANCGFISKMIIDKGYSGKIVLFEPIPNLLSNATRLLEYTPNEKLYVNAAVGEQDGRIDLFVPVDSNIGWITAVGQRTDSTQKFEVNVIDPANLIEAYKPAFVKLDVEGFEAIALTRFVDAIETDSSYRPSFLIEISWGTSNPHWARLLSHFEVLLDLGYKVFDLKADMKELDLAVLREFTRTTDVLVRKTD